MIIKKLYLYMIDTYPNVHLSSSGRPPALEERASTRPERKGHPPALEERASTRPERKGHPDGVKETRPESTPLQRRRLHHVIYISTSPIGQVLVPLTNAVQKKMEFEFREPRLSVEPPFERMVFLLLSGQPRFRMDSKQVVPV